MGTHWGTRCSSWTKLVRTPTRKTRGKTVRKNDGTWLGKRTILGCLLAHRKQNLFLSVYVDDMKMAGKKQNLALMWKKIDERRGHWGANMISWSRLLRMHSTGMQTHWENSWTTQQIVRIRISAGTTVKITRMGQTPRENFLRHGGTCSKMRGTVLRIGKQKRRSNFSKFLILVWTITKSKRRNWIMNVNWQKIVPILW